MEDIELQKIWRDYDARLEQSRILNLQSWALNLKCYETLQTQKVVSKLSRLAAFKKRAVLLGIVWVIFLALLIYGNRFTNVYFSASISAIFLINIIILAAYIRDIVLIRQINYSESITLTQEKLATLQTFTFNMTRIAWLQMPFYTTFFWSSSWIDYSSFSFWLISFPVTLSFVALTVFLYRNISLENMHKKWVKWLMMTGPEYKSVIEAMDFMKEIEEFKKDQAF